MKREKEHPISSRVSLRIITRTVVVRFVGMTIVVLVSFFLGNLVGSWMIEKGFVPAEVFRKFRLSGTVKQSAITPSPQQSSGRSKPVRIGNQDIEQPGPDASPEEFTVFTDAIREVEKEASEVTIGIDCSLSPQAIRARRGTRITFVNSTGNSYTIVFGIKDGSLALAAQSSTSFDATLKGVGIYSIICQDIQVGFLHIVE